MKKYITTAFTLFYFFANFNYAKAAIEEIKPEIIKEDLSLYFKKCLKTVEISSNCLKKYETLENKILDWKKFTDLTAEITGHSSLNNRDKISILNNDFRDLKQYKSQNDLSKFLRLWSSYGLWNYKMFNKISAQKEKAEIALTQHYQDYLKIKKEEAKAAANLALDYYLATGMNYNPNYDKISQHPILEAIWNKKSKNDLIKTTEENPFNFTNLNYQNNQYAFAWRMALNAAIIQNYDLDTISWLLNQEKESIKLYETSEEKSFANANHMSIFDKIDSIGNEETLTAIAINNLRILEFLLKQGFNPNSRNIIGKTPAFFAIQEKNIDALKLLQKYGANLHLVTYMEARKPLMAGNRTTLMYAAWQGNLEIVKFLIEKGVRNDLGADTNREMAINYLEKNHDLKDGEKEEIKRILQQKMILRIDDKIN